VGTRIRTVTVTQPVSLGGHWRYFKRNWRLSLAIPHPVMLETDPDEFGDIIGDIYTERTSNLLYEVKFFQDFVLVRPANPTFYLALRKLSHLEFANEFAEYWGDHAAVKEAIRGMSPDLVID
jgi:hypothetical protein